MIEQRASEARDGEEVVEQRPHWATPLVRGWMILQPLLWRPLGMSRIKMTVLGGIKLSEVGQSTVLLPIGDDEQVRAALDAL